ncbi:MAG: TIGR01777 family protein [Chlamydiales bacterium]|nr:TIGR01777 family protein [Chlamydiales bacterium]
MKILVSGSSGLVGSALVLRLEGEGHEVWKLVRAKPQAEGSVFWDPQTGQFDREQMEGFDALVHLAGENIAAHRWTHAQKNRLFLSRCRDTWLLSQALTRLKQPPHTLITASACGFYGDRGLEPLTEESPKGNGFLADLCGRWEQSTATAEESGIRVVHARFGIGLSPKGGALQKMLTPFRLGLGGRLGSGLQIMPWVAVEDMVGAISHLLQKQDIRGAVNICSPHSVPQKEFAKLLAEKLHRPAFFHIPAAVLRLLLGEMANELLLTSANVEPKRLLKSGYVFRYPDLKGYFDSLII